jgi:predicted ATPase
MLQDTFRHIARLVRFIAHRDELRALSRRSIRPATDLARLWMNQDKRTEARNVLSSIYRCFSEGFDTHDLKEAKAVLDALAQ